MAVTAQNPYKSFTAAPGATVFSSEFRVIQASDLIVRVDGVIVTAGFSVAGLGAPAGVDVTFTVPMVGGELVELLREVPLTRATDYQIAGDFLSPVVNIDFDRLWMAMQGLGRRIATSLRVPFSEQIGELPPLAQRANRYLAFNASGEPVAVEGTSSDVVVTPFAQGLLDDTTDEAARTTLGASAVGSNVFTALDGPAARTALGASAVGSNVFTAATQAAARTALGLPSLYSLAALAKPLVSTWTLRTSAADNMWDCVCWSPERGLFVAVAFSGIGNRVMTSPDGITWTLRTSAADNMWLCVCWAPELGLFVAVSSSGTGNRVMTSPDGITWTIRTSAADNNWRAVCWSPERGLFVAVADTGTGNRVMTSVI